MKMKSKTVHESLLRRFILKDFNARHMCRSPCSSLDIQALRMAGCEWCPVQALGMGMEVQVVKVLGKLHPGSSDRCSWERRDRCRNPHSWQGNQGRWRACC